MPPGRTRPRDAEAGDADPGDASLEDLDFGVERGRDVEPRSPGPFEVGVEKAVHAVRRDGKLAASVDTDDTCHAEPPEHDMALQQGAIVAEQVMVRAADRDAQPAGRRQMIVNRLDVGPDLPADRVGRIAMVAEEDHERLAHALLNDA